MDCHHSYRSDYGRRARERSDYHIDSTDSSSDTCRREHHKAGGNRKGILKDRRHGLQDQVSNLCSDLCDGNRTMSENERLMSDFQTTSQRQRLEMNELKRDLDRSRDFHSNTLHVSRTVPSSVHFSDGCSCQLQRSMNDLERERLARERSDTEKSRALDLLNTSLSRSNPTSLSTTGSVTADPLLHDLTSDVKTLKNELTGTQIGMAKSEFTTANMESRVRDIEKKVLEGSVHVKSERQLDELSEEIKLIKDDLWRKEANDRQQTLLKELRDLESQLSSERHKYSSSRLEVDKLSTQVSKLGEDLQHAHDDKRKVFSYLKATNHQLDVSLMGKEALIQQIEELRQQLKQSEESRLFHEKKCVCLEEKFNQQEGRQESLRDRVQDVERKIQCHQEDRVVLVSRIEELNSLLATSQVSEARLRDDCNHLDAQLADRSVQDELLDGLRRKVEDIEHECSQGRLEITQLRGELQDGNMERNSLLEKISVLEAQLSQSEHDCAGLREEARDLSVQLQSSQHERSLVGAESLDRIRELQEQTNKLNAEVTKLENKLDQQTTHSGAEKSQIVKKYTAHCAKLKKDKQRMASEMEAMKITCKCKELEDQLALCQSHMDADQNGVILLQQENVKWKVKTQALQKKCKQFSEKCRQLESVSAELRVSEEASKHSMEKCQEELSILQTDKESLVLENSSLQQDLNQTMERINVCHREMEDMKSQQSSDNQKTSSLSQKVKKITAAYNNVRANVASLQSEQLQLKMENSQLEEHVHQVQQSSIQGEQELRSEMDTLQVVHRQELDSLVREHNQMVFTLKQENAQLQVKLSDEQSTLRAVRMQQFKAIDDQQRIVEEDLSRSLKDSEKVRHKYLKTKQFYREKVAMLEKRLIASESEETAGLCQRLSQQQEEFLQLNEEHQALLRALETEVDILVDKMSARVDIPEFPSGAVGRDAKALFAELLTKTQWLKKEVVDLLIQEDNLRRLLRGNEKDYLDVKAGRPDEPTCRSKKTNPDSSFQLEHLY